MTYRRGIMALEENSELAGMVPVVEPEVVVDFAETAEAPMIEMNAAEAGLEYVSDDMQDAADTADTLDQMAAGIEETVPEGGLSEPAAKTIEVAVEGFKRQLAFVKTRGYSLEGFGDKTTRVNATKLALEDIKETVKKIWLGIVQAFQNVIAWIKTFTMNMLDASARLKTKAEAMVKLSEGKNVAADAKVDSASFAEYLHSGGKLLDAQGIAGAITSLSEVRNMSHIEVSAMLTEVEADIKKTIESKGKEAGQFKFTTKFKAATAPKGVSVPEGCVLVSASILPGDKEAFLVLPDKGDSPAARFLKLGKAKAFVAASADAKPAPTGEVSALSADDIKLVAMSVMKQMDDLVGMKAALEKTTKDLNLLVSSSKKASELKDTNAQETSNLKAAAAAARTILSVTTGNQAAINSYSVKSAKAALDYCAKSLATTKAKKEDKK